MVTHKIGLRLYCLRQLLKSSNSNLASRAIQLKTATMTTLCVIYVSEGVKQNVIEQLTQKATAGGPLVHSFIDATYGRTSFYLMGDNLVDRSVDLCKEAFQLIPYDPMQGTHPALGVVDHISFAPIGPSSSLLDARSAAVEFASKLYKQEKVPVFLYGEASPKKAYLKEIRKDLGYFLKGEEMIDNMKKSTAVPDYGNMSTDFDKLKGISCVGAVNYLQNFNIRFRASDERKHLIQITKHLRETDVEALTLQHEEGSYEVACNLRNPRVTTPAMVLKKAEKLIFELGLSDSVAIAHSYTTGPTETELLARLT